MFNDLYDIKILFRFVINLEAEIWCLDHKINAQKWMFTKTTLQL